MSNKYGNKNGNRNNELRVQREVQHADDVPTLTEVAPGGVTPAASRNESMRTFAKFVVLAVVIAAAFLYFASQAQAEDVIETGDLPVAEASAEPPADPAPTEEEDTTSFFDNVSAWFADKEEAAKEVDERAAALDAREAELNDYATALAEREELLSAQNAEIGVTAEELKAKANNLKQCVIDAVSGL